MSTARPDVFGAFSSVDPWEILRILFPVVVVGGGVLIFWALPVWLGIRWAKAKGYSPLWMLFGLHPIGAWIAAAVIQVLPVRERCPECQDFVRADFNVCPHCGQDLAAAEDEVELLE